MMPLEHEDILGGDCLSCVESKLLFPNGNENIVGLISELITRGQSLLFRNHERTLS